MKKNTITLLELRKLIAKKAFQLLKERIDDEEEDYSDDEEKYSFDRFKSGDEFEVDSDTEDIFNDEPGTIKKKLTPLSLKKPESEIGDVKDFSEISSITNNISKELTAGQLKVANNLIQKAINNGRVGPEFNYQKFSSTKDQTNLFNYITSVLAALYKDESYLENKQNIKKALRSAIGDAYSFSGSRIGLSRLASNIVRNAKIDLTRLNTILNTVDGQEYLDIINDAIDEAFEYVLENYNKDRGVFSTVFLFNAGGKVKSGLQTKRAKASFSSAVGSKYMKGKSLDEPMGGEDDDNDATFGDTITGAESEISTSQKEGGKELANAMFDFLKSRIQTDIKDGAINEKSFIVFKLLFDGKSLSEISDETGIKPGTVRQLKRRLEEFINENYVKTGRFQNYIKKRTGINIKFPDDKYSFSVQGVDEKGRAKEEVEQELEYFDENAIDPETKQRGAWIKISNKDKGGDVEPGNWFDDYGSLVFGEKPEENDEEPEDFGPDDKGLNESFIAKQLMKMVIKRIQND
jgi:DNA-binding CsgD family transcriptional regulator